MLRQSFGSSASRVAARIGGDVPILACEPSHAAAVLEAALTQRRAGTHFALSTHVDDARAVRLRERAREYCATYATWDEVRLMLDHFATTIGDQRAEISEPDRASLYEAVRLADTVVVRSWCEHARLVDLIGNIRRDVDIVVNEDPSVSPHVEAEPTDIVVYGPIYRADELAPFVAALRDFEIPVTIVARDQPTIPSRVRFEPPERAAEVLARARVIIDANDEPGVALALAAFGRPLAVSSVSGATEIMSGVRSYEPWNRRSILTAAVHGLAASPPVLRAGRWSDRPTARARPAFGSQEPLVSIIIATYNRPVALAASLAAIDRQNYPTLEIIVVNDGGVDVSQLVARYPRARLIDQASNRGPAAARNCGLAAAQGEFAMFFDDDDEMFPDHVAMLAKALERSGLDVAYGQMMNCFVVPAGRNAGDAFAGHTALLDHADIQWAGAIAPTALLFRRSLIERIGPIDESLDCAEDYEFWLRLAAGREWARVSDVTSLYFIGNDGANRSAKDGVRRHLTAHRAIYAKHPSPRPLVQAGRASMLQYFSGA